MAMRQNYKQKITGTSSPLTAQYFANFNKGWFSERIVGKNSKATLLYVRTKC